MALLRVFGQHVEAALLQVGAHVEAAYVFRQVKLVVSHYIIAKCILLARGAKCKDILVAFVFRHGRQAECKISIVLAQRLYPLVQIQLYIGAGNPTLVVIPIAALLTREGFQRNAFEGAQHKTCAAQRIVDAEATFFVSTEDKA